MIAYDFKPVKQDNRIVVIPSSPKYAEQMVELMCATYNCLPEETFSVEQFRTHMQIFPEGQFIALDVDNDRVVGLTASMRVDFNPDEPLLENWVETTNYG